MCQIDNGLGVCPAIRDLDSEARQYKNNQPLISKVPQSEMVLDRERTLQKLTTGMFYTDKPKPGDKHCSGVTWSIYLCI